MEYENPKEFKDKYSNCSFKGSKLTKDVEREVENEKIIEIKSNTNLFLETKEEPENKNYIDFGIKNFYYNSSSKIILKKIQKDKSEDINFVKRLCSKLNLIESDTLIQSIIDKEIEEQNNLDQNKSKSDTSISENRIRNRNLQKESIWESLIGYSWVIVRTNILGQETTISYYVDLIDGKIKNRLVIRFGWSTIALGNIFGLDKNKMQGSDKRDDIPLLKIPLGCLPVQISLKLGCLLDFDLGLISSNKLKIDFYGTLFIKAGIEFGIGNIAKNEAGIKGDFISLDFSTTFKKDWDRPVKKDIISLKTTSGKVYVYALAKI